MEAHTAQVCQALAERGAQVTLYAKEGSRVDHQGTGPGSIEVVPVLGAGFEWGSQNAPSDAGRLDEATARACALAAHHDVVLNNTLNPVPYTALPDAAMLTVLHTPATLERVDEVVTRPDWQPGARHRWVSVSESNAGGWRRLLRGIDVGVVHNGVDLGRWSFGDSPGGHLAWSARITPEKGLHVAIDAALAAGLPLRIAGPASNASYFAEEIAPRLASHPDQLEYVGHLDHHHLPAFLASAAAFACTPLWDEPFGLSPLEAMACGTPVAALANGALPELLGTSGGVLAADESDLPRAMLTARSLPRAAVRERATAFSLDAMVDGYLDILRPLAAQRPSTPR